MVVMNKAAGALLPVSWVGNDKKKMMMKKKKKAFWLPLFHEMVCVWALVNALAFAIAGILTAMDIPNVPCSPSSAWNPCAEKMTDAQDHQVRALLNGTFWCCVPQAAAAALALLLPRRRRSRSRRALAFVALAATAAAHLMHARVLVILVATTPGHLLLKTVATAADSFIVLCDLLGFLGLLFMAGEDE